MVTILAIGLIVAALSGVPLFAILGGAALLCFYSIGVDSAAVIIEMVRLAEAPTLVAIPLFTFAGYMLAESKAPQRLLYFYRSWFGWIPAGLPLVCLIACAFFTAFTGASGITIIALGGLILPILREENFKETFSMGLITTSGSLGLLFPPSLPLILYALVAQVRLDHLFLAGLLPGALLVVLLGLYGVWIGRKTLQEKRTFQWAFAKQSFRGAFWELLLPILLLSAIYGGFATASEAAALTVAYVLLVEMFVHRDLSFRRDISRIAWKSMILVGGILVILGCAMGFTNFLVDAQVPMQTLAWIQQYIKSPLMFLLVLNGFLLIVGCLMDIFSAIIIVVPLILPLAKGFGIDPVHLGIIFLTNLEIGYLTPPVGLNLFVASLRFKRPMADLYRASLPFLLVLIVGLLLITYVPVLSLGLLKFFN